MCLGPLWILWLILGLSASMSLAEGSCVENLLQNKMAAVICSFPSSAYESFKLFRALPRNIELMHLVYVNQLGHRDVHLTLNNLIYRGHDIGLQLKFSNNILNSQEDYLALFQEAKESIRSICGYNVKFIGLESSQPVSSEFMKAVKTAQLHIFRFQVLEKLCAEDKIIGTDLLSMADLKVLIDHIHFFQKSGYSFHNVPEYIHGPIQTILTKKSLQIVLSGIPKCKWFRRFVKGLLKRTGFKCSVLVDFKACTKEKKLKKFKKAFKLGVIPVYYLTPDNSADAEMSWREIDVALRSFERLAKGGAVIEHVFVQDSTKLKALRKIRGSADIKFRCPSLAADGRIAPKAVKIYLSNLSPGSTVLLKVKTANDHTDCHNLKQILTYIADYVEFE